MSGDQAGHTLPTPGRNPILSLLAGKPEEAAQACLSQEAARGRTRHSFSSQLKAGITCQEWVTQTELARPASPQNAEA